MKLYELLALINEDTPISILIGDKEIWTNNYIINSPYTLIKHGQDEVDIVYAEQSKIFIRLKE